MILVAHRTPLSAAACARVTAAGATVFEADVQVDDAGAVVVTHYLPLGSGRHVERDNWRVRWHTGRAGDPRLSELVEIVPSACRVLLDLKERHPDRRARLVAALIDTLPDRSRFVVCGHPVEDVATLREAGFRSWRSVGNRAHLAAVLADGPLPDDAVSIRHSLLDRVVLDRLHAQVPEVIAWTVNGAGRAGKLRALGVDGITTDSRAVLHRMSAISN